MPVFNTTLSKDACSRSPTIPSSSSHALIGGLVGAALRMADDDGLGAGIGQHLGQLTDELAHRTAQLGRAADPIPSPELELVGLTTVLGNVSLFLYNAAKS